MSTTDPGFIAALEEAKKGAGEGGVPIGACLVDENGKILARGHNLRVQRSSAILHVCTTINTVLAIESYPVGQAEMSTLESLGRQPAKVYEGSTMYTTLSPCQMCTGACILYKVSRVVM